MRLKQTHFHVTTLTEPLPAAVQQTLESFYAGMRVPVRGQVRLLGESLVTLIASIGPDPFVAIVMDLHRARGLER